jgi:hypothetical protein
MIVLLMVLSLGGAQAGDMLDNICYWSSLLLNLVNTVQASKQLLNFLEHMTWITLSTHVVNM